MRIAGRVVVGVLLADEARENLAVLVDRVVAAAEAKNPSVRFDANESPTSTTPRAGLGTAVTLIAAAPSELMVTTIRRRLGSVVDSSNRTPFRIRLALRTRRAE